MVGTMAATTGVQDTGQSATGNVQPIKEMVGRVMALAGGGWNKPVFKTFDATKVDYAFYDKLRHGVLPGFELAGLFAKPITETLASYVMGGAFTATIDTQDGASGGAASDEATDHTNDQLRRFIDRNSAVLLRLVTDMYALADQYVVINPDGTLSTPSPDTVNVEYNAVDYRRLEKVTITSKLEKVEIKDVYTSETRVVIIKNITQEAVTLPDGTVLKPRQESKQEYTNLIGVIPVVQLSNERSANELFGRPVYAALYHLFSKYNDLISKGLSGAELLSNPPLVFSNLEDVDEAWEHNTIPTGEMIDGPDGTEVEERTIDAHGDVPAYFVTGDVHFASPGAFTADLRNMLQMLFLLMLEFIRIPESIWGGEMGQARATSGEQMKVFYQHIRARRQELEGVGPDAEFNLSATGLKAIVDIWLRMRALTDRQIVVGDVAIDWPELEKENEDIHLRKVDMAANRGWITDETGLRQLALPGILDEAEEIERAQSDADERRDPFERAVDNELRTPEPDEEDVTDKGSVEDNPEPEPDGELVAA